jgi:hypothetical protein
VYEPTDSIQLFSSAMSRTSCFFRRRGFGDNQHIRFTQIPSKKLLHVKFKNKFELSDFLCSRNS